MKFLSLENWNVNIDIFLKFKVLVLIVPCVSTRFLDFQLTEALSFSKQELCTMAQDINLICSSHNFKILLLLYRGFIYSRDIELKDTLSKLDCWNKGFVYLLETLSYEKSFIVWDTHLKLFLDFKGSWFDRKVLILLYLLDFAMKKAFFSKELYNFFYTRYI